MVARIVAMLTLAGTLLAPVAFAASGGGYPLLQFTPVTTDKAALQRGLRTFVNYCQGCHSAKYMRYQRVAEDLGIPDDIMKDNIMWGTDSMAATMTNAIDAETGKILFSAAPPDLSLIARARGARYVYTYMMSFYEDPSRPTGANNALLPGSSMPHVMWELQGVQRGQFEERHDPRQAGITSKVLVGVELIKTGLLSEKEYSAMMTDLTNFLVYLGESSRDKRRQIGFWVILFLLGYAVITWLLYKEYWRDIS